MAIQPLAAPALTPMTGRDALPSASEAGGGAFPRMLQNLLGDAARGHESVETAVREMALGQTDNLHGVMLKMAQADLAFHLILEIRNRLTDAYQEIMKMQV